jgi:predicted alpha/beta superfamily hydrolase
MPQLIDLFVLLALAPSLALAQASAPAAPGSDGTPITFGTSHRIDSAILGESRALIVWLPPGHDTAETPYTVLYLIDGGVEQDYPHIAGLAQLGVFGWQFQPLIVVGTETGERIHELTPAPQDPLYINSFDTSGGAADFRAYIAEEVIPFIESHYRVGERRAIIGESLAGLFIVDTLLEQPDLFDDYIAISPSLWWDDQAASRGAAEHLAAANREDWRLYLTMADEGGTMQAGLDRLLTALQDTPGAPDWRHVDRRDSETHATVFHPAALDALRWLYSYPPYDYGPTPWYLREDGSPDDDG